MSNSNLSASLREIISGLHKGLRNRTSSVSAYSMTEMETIGFLLRHERLLPSELALLTRVKTQSMSQIINKLYDAGIIKRTPSKEDKRKVYVSLTASGKKLVEKVKYERDEWLKQVIETSLTNKEKELLARTLPLLNKLLSHI